MSIKWKECFGTKFLAFPVTMYVASFFCRVSFLNAHLDPVGSRRFPVGRSPPREILTQSKRARDIYLVTKRSLSPFPPPPPKRRSIEFSGIIGQHGWKFIIIARAAFRDPTLPASFQSLRNCERTRLHLYMVFTLLLSLTRGQLLLSNATREG